MPQLPYEFLAKMAVRYMLSAQQKEAFILLFANSSKNELEIAMQLNISASALRSRISGIYQKFSINGGGPGKLHKLHNFLLEEYQKTFSTKSDAIESTDTDALVQEIRQEIENYIRERCGTLRVLDMPHPIELTGKRGIYIHVKILEKITGRRHLSIEELLKNSNRANFKRFTFSQLIEKQVSGLEAVQRFNKLMILGKPGAGKTTFLKYLAMQCIVGMFHPDKVPCFITIKDFAQATNQPDLVDYITHQFATCGVTNANRKLKHLLSQGRVLVLLDSLDEIQQEDTKRVLRQIRDISERFYSNHFIITSRIASEEYTFERFTEVEIADFGQEEIETFVRNWFQVRGEEKISDRFLENLEENQQIKELATSPLLLTILCLTFEDNYDFSRNRYGLYADAVDTLLRRWDASRRIERHPNFNLSRQRKINMFSEIAYEGLSHNPPQFLWTSWELQDQISKFLERIVYEEIDIQQILKFIEANYGLLTQQAKGIYSFSPLTFQEYFAAEYIVENRQTKFLINFVEQNLLRRQWREVFILTVERMSNADELLKLMFRRINDIVKNSRELQAMLSWLHRMTTNAGISSSAWRAYYLAIDLDVDLYISRDIEIERPIFGKFAIELRNYNKKYQKLTLPRPKALLISRLAAIHALAIDHANLADSKQIQLKNTDFTRKGLEISDDLDIDINEKLTAAIEKAKEAEISDLTQELIDLQSRHPASDASSSAWERWAEELRQLMLDHLDIGYKVNFSADNITLLEEYIYANYLLFECIYRGNNFSLKLRDEIIDHLLLPQDKIPTHLLSN